MFCCLKKTFLGAIIIFQKAGSISPRRNEIVMQAVQPFGRRHAIFGRFAQISIRGGVIFAGDEKISSLHK
jgi:hypothetical protein